MVEIGRYNTLTVIKTVDFGVYLDGGERGEILMPKEYVPANTTPGDEVNVFVYFDSEDRIVATTEEPMVKVGEFAYLKVVAVNRIGAFLDWGLRKDLFVPFREQREPEHCTAVLRVFCSNASAVGFYDSCANRESYSEIALLSVRASAEIAVIARKEGFEPFLCYSAAVVGDFENRLAVYDENTERESCKALCVVDGVFEDINDDLLDEHGVHRYQHDVLGNV